MLLFCGSTNSMLQPYKDEFCCCLLMDACAIAAYQNTLYVPELLPDLEIFFMNS
jgi:hypothetical protein